MGDAPSGTPPRPNAAASLLYWATMLAACSIGETAADLVSHELGLGYVRASSGFVALFGVLGLVERRARVRPAARYWTAIVLMSTTGTTLADLFTRTLGLGYAGASLLLGTGFLAVLLGRGRLHGERRGASALLPHAHVHLEHGDIPDTDVGYWAAVMVASTLGTSLGDFVSDALAIGFGPGTLLLGSALAAVLVADHVATRSSVVRYWAALVAASTIGATSGDWLTKEDGLALPFPSIIAVQVALFLGLAVAGSLRAGRTVGPTASGVPHAGAVGARPGSR